MTGALGHLLSLPKNSLSSHKRSHMEITTYGVRDEHHETTSHGVVHLASDNWSWHQPRPRANSYGAQRSRTSQNCGGFSTTDSAPQKLGKGAGSMGLSAVRVTMAPFYVWRLASGSIVPKVGGLSRLLPRILSVSHSPCRALARETPISLCYQETEQEKGGSRSLSLC